jgi:SAM-dependent methyltransferase
MRHSTREQLLAFWDRSTLAEAKAVIGDDVWDERIEEDLALIFLGIPELLDDARKTKYCIVAEIGCGIGRLLKPLAESGYQTVGLDTSPTMLSHAINFLKDVPETRIPVLAHIVDNRFPISSGIVDFAFSFMTLQHVDDKTLAAYIVETKRILRRGGIVKAQIRARQSIPSIGAFVGLFEGFSIVTYSSGIGNPDWLWVTARKP